MRSLRRSDRGLSEIVGTLMLVVIVVTAATLLAAFVASYQKQLQTEESFSHDQSLESIHILALTTKLNPEGTNFTEFGFTLASEYINPSVILGISINNNPLKNFSWENLDNYSSKGYTLAGQNLDLSPFEELSVSTDLSWSSPAFSFFDNASIPVPDHYLKFDIYTVLQNDFSRVFLPPVPLEVVSEVNPSGGPNPDVQLDGSESFQPEGNATLLQWNWTVENSTRAFLLGPLYGEVTDFALSTLTSNVTYAVTLTVTNSDGLIGSITLPYTAPYPS